MVHLVLVFAIMLFATAQALVRLPNIGCASHTHQIFTHKNRVFMPFVVDLNRCSGKDTSHIFMKCAPTKTENVTIGTYRFDGSISKTVVANETSCEERCILKQSHCNPYQTYDDKNCQCNCPHTRPPSSCVEPFYWNGPECNCKCMHTKDSFRCPTWKEFSVKECDCICLSRHVSKCRKKEGKVFNHDTCVCEDVKVILGKLEHFCKKDISTTVIFVLLLFEAITLCIILFFYKRYSDKKESNKEGDSPSTNNNSEVTPTIALDSLPQLDPMDKLDIRTVDSGNSSNYSLYGAEEETDLCFSQEKHYATEV